MKKIISLVAGILLVASTSAQIVTSNTRLTTVEKNKSSQWYWKAGVNIVSLSGSDAEDVKSNTGYSTVFGFHRDIRNAGAYWGMEFGFGNRGFTLDWGDGDKDKVLIHNFQYAPVNFGWKYEVIDGLKIDGHVGIYASYDFAGKYKEEWGGHSESLSFSEFKDDYDWNCFDAGMNIGVGVWYRRLNFDLTYQPGFLKAMEDIKVHTSNFMIRLGIAF